MPSSIYQVENTINKKSYIGFTTLPIDKRMKKHLYDVKSGSVLYFHNAIRKYGFENFTVKILYQSLDSKHCLDVVEGYFIKTLNTKKPGGYNLTDGGEGALGCKHTEEQIRKMVESKLKISPDKEDFLVVIEKSKMKKNIIEYYGVSNTVIDRWAKEFGIILEFKSGDALRGVKRPISVRNKISKGHMGKMVSPITKEKLRIHQTGKSQSAYTRNKISDTLKRVGACVWLQRFIKTITLDEVIREDLKILIPNINFSLEFVPIGQSTQYKECGFTLYESDWKADKDLWKHKIQEALSELSV